MVPVPGLKAKADAAVVNVNASVRESFMVCCSLCYTIQGLKTTYFGLSC